MFPGSITELGFIGAVIAGDQSSVQQSTIKAMVLKQTHIFILDDQKMSLDDFETNRCTTLTVTA